MYTLSRLILMCAVLLLAYSTVVLCIIGGWPGWIVLGLLLMVAFKRKGKILTTLGSGRFATEDEMRGLIGAKHGLILGRLCSARANIIARIGMLLNGKLPAKEACQKFLGKDELVRLPQTACHASVYAPTGIGKGVSVLLPWLLSPDNDESCVCVDYKAELASLTAIHRWRMGHEIVILDPWGVAKLPFKKATHNPLDWIDRESASAVDDCNSLANALVVRTGEEKEPHWNDRAEAWLAGMIAATVYYGQKDKGTRSLQRVAQLLSSPAEMKAAVALMMQSPEAWGGSLAMMGGQLSHSVGEELGSTLSTVGRFARFLSSAAAAESLKFSNFDPSRLSKGKMTIYCILPLEQMRVQAPLLRLWLSSFMRAVIRGGLNQKRNTHFVIDEAAAVGQMDSISDALNIGRGYSIRLQLYYQSMGQLKACWPKDEGQALLSNSTQILFGVNDIQTAEYVSKRLGQETIVVEGGGRNSGNSRSYSTIGAQGNTSYSDGASADFKQQSRSVLTSDEVLALDPRIAITFIAGMRPVMTRLIRYYEEKRLTASRFYSGGTCLKSLCLLLLAGCVAFAATKMIGGKNGGKSGGEAVRRTEVNGGSGSRNSGSENRR